GKWLHALIEEHGIVKRELFTLCDVAQGNHIKAFVTCIGTTAVVLRCPVNRVLIPEYVDFLADRISVLPEIGFLFLIPIFVNISLGDYPLRQFLSREDDFVLL